MSVTVNGAKISERHAFEAYREIISDLFDATRPEGVEGGYAADFQARALDGLFMHWGFHGASRYDRTPERVRKDGLDDIAVMLICEGRWKADFAGERRVLAPGHLVVLDRSRPLLLESRDNRFINLNLPRHLLERMSVQLNGVHGRLLDHPAARMLADVMLSVAMHDPDGPGVGETMLHAAASALGGITGCASEVEGPSQLLRQRVMQLVDANLFDPELDATVVANALGTSRATLYRAFARECGVATFIRSRRLSEARLRLADPAHGPIGTIALEVGFGSHALFTQHFRRRFGITPRAFARRSRHRGDIQARGGLDGPTRLDRWSAIAEIATQSRRP